MIDFDWLWFLQTILLHDIFNWKSTFLWSFNNVKLLSKTNPGPFFRHYDALAVGFSANFLSQWEQLNSSQKTVSLMCSLVTNQLITDRKGATQIVNNNLLWGVSEQHFFMCTVNNMESNKKNSLLNWNFYYIEVL